MMRRWTSGLLGLGVLLASGGLATAQEPARPARSEADRLTKIRRAGEVIGLAVKNAADESLGRIDDLLFSADGMCRFVIVGDGGTLGIGENYIAVPSKALKCDEANKVARIDMTRAKFETAPMFKKANYHERWTPEWTSGVYTFFGVEEPKRKAVSTDARPTPEVFYASQFMKANVENNDSTKLAQATDIICDDHMRAHFAILSHGGVLKIGDKELAVPWRALKLRKGEGQNLFVVLNMTSKQLEGAPVLSRENYADLLDTKFVDSNYRYFGVEGRREIETEQERKRENK